MIKTIRSSRPEVFFKKVVLRNFAKTHKKLPVPGCGLQIY